MLSPWMAPTAAPAPAALRRCLAVAALLAVIAPQLASAAGLGDQESVLAPRQGFWHYAMLEDEASATTEVRRQRACLLGGTAGFCPAQRRRPDRVWGSFHLTDQHGPMWRHFDALTALCLSTLTPPAAGVGSAAV